MIAENILSNGIVPLRTSDTGDDALAIMDDNRVSHLPIVNNEQLLGVISEDDIFNNDSSEAVGSYPLSLHKYAVRKGDHIYEVMRLLAEYRITVIPVMDNEDNYVGMVSLEDLLTYFASKGSFTEPGSIIVLEMHRRDYSLAEMSRIVESENAAVLSSFITSDLNSSRIDVTLKVNSKYIGNIIATFERFKYQIKASFNENDYLDSLKERYDSLVSYLNV